MTAHEPPFQPVNSPQQPTSGTSGQSQSQSSAQPGENAAGFCQNCGKALTPGTRRVVGSAVFCEPCLEARVHGAPPSSATWQQTYTGAYGGGSGPGPIPGPIPGWTPTAAGPMPAAPPNPGLAALLGFIPGVGAMYNEQYVKGLIHLMVFAFLIILTDHANGIFGLFIAGWVFYMVIEAHHTAKARRDGTPLPDPFGFNNLAERIGLGRAFHVGAHWPPHTGYNPAAPPAAGASGSANPNPAYSAQAGPATTATGSDWNHSGSAGAPPTDPGARWDAYGQSVNGSANAYAHQAGAANPFGAGSANPFDQAPYPGAGMPADPLAPEPVVAEPLTPLQRFPAGALWLIVLGFLFLLSTTRIFRGFSGAVLLGWAMISIASWLMLRRYAAASTSTAASPLPRIVHALNSGLWVLITGFLALLDGYGIAGWSRSWPIYLIAAGFMAILSRLASANYASAPVPPYPGAGPVSNGPVPPTPGNPFPGGF